MAPSRIRPGLIPAVVPRYRRPALNPRIIDLMMRQSQELSEADRRQMAANVAPGQLVSAYFGGLGQQVREGFAHHQAQEDRRLALEDRQRAIEDRKRLHEATVREEAREVAGILRTEAIEDAESLGTESRFTQADLAIGRLPSTPYEAGSTVDEMGRPSIKRGEPIAALAPTREDIVRLPGGGFATSIPSGLPGEDPTLRVLTDRETTERLDPVERARLGLIGAQTEGHRLATQLTKAEMEQLKNKTWAERGDYWILTDPSTGEWDYALDPKTGERILTESGRPDFSLVKHGNKMILVNSKDGSVKDSGLDVPLDPADAMTLYVPRIQREFRNINAGIPLDPSLLPTIRAELASQMTPVQITAFLENATDPLVDAYVKQKTEEHNYNQALLHSTQQGINPIASTLIAPSPSAIQTWRSEGQRLYSIGRLGRSIEKQSGDVSMGLEAPGVPLSGEPTSLYSPEAPSSASAPGKLSDEQSVWLNDFSTPIKTLEGMSEAPIERLLELKSELGDDGFNQLIEALVSGTSERNVKMKVGGRSRSIAEPAKVYAEIIRNKLDSSVGYSYHTSRPTFRRGEGFWSRDEADEK
jgi:hypothetical protein